MSYNNLLGCDSLAVTSIAIKNLSQEVFLFVQKIKGCVIKMENVVLSSPRTKALKKFLKQQNSLSDNLPIVGSESVFDVDGMMFYVLKENEVKETVRRLISSFILNVEKIEMCPKRYLAKFDQKEYKVDGYLIYRMV